jgi:hypothetical protein
VSAGGGGLHVFLVTSERLSHRARAAQTACCATGATLRTTA